MHGDAPTNKARDRIIGFARSINDLVIFVFYLTMPSNAKASVAAIWTIAHSALYGFHITSLNGVQASVLCSDRSAQVARFGLRECLDLSVSL